MFQTLLQLTSYSTDVYVEVTLGLAVTTLGLLFFLYRRSSGDGYPDGPRTFPILGNLPQIIAAGDMVTFLEKNRKIYGNVFAVEIGGVRRVVISGSENMQYLLIKNADYTSNRTPNAMPAQQIQIAKTRPGLIWAPYPHWKTVRTLALNVLRDEGMGKPVMEPKILSEIELYIHHFIEPNLGIAINMTLSLTYATSNIISHMVTGERFDYDDPDFHRLNTAFENAVKSNMKASITKNIPFVRYLPGSISGQDTAKETVEVIRPRLVEMVAHARKNLSTVQNNFISQALLKSEHADEEGTELIFTDDNIQSTTAQLYGAGTETTSTALRWALLYMVLYPDIQERVRKEIHEVIGERQVSMKDRLSLLYTDAVLHEVLRCGNIVPTNLPHTLDKKMVIENKVIPAGAELLFNMTSVMADPELYPEPDQFKPERFLGTDGQILKTKIMAFGVGRRACLGEPLARMEFFLFFVSFLQKFKLSYPPERKPTLNPIVSIVRGPTEYDIIFQRSC